MSIATQIWLTFALGILKDVILQFVINNEKFRRAFFWTKRQYLLITLPYWKFLKHYKNFIKEKNEIFSLMMSDYQKNTPKDPIFFFSALTQYWLLKKTLIKQYEKILNIHLVDDDYDIFEDEVKKARSIKTKDSLKRLIWKIKITDKDFEEEFNKSVDNLQFLKKLTKNTLTSAEEYNPHDYIDITTSDSEKPLKTLKSYIKDENILLSKWASGNNKIRNIEKFELYTETKLIQKYAKEFQIKVNHKDSVNLLRVTNILNNSLVYLVNFLGAKNSKNKKFCKKFIKSEKSYVKIYYKLLIKKYLLLEYKKPIKELSGSDASLIITKSNLYLSEKNKLLEEAQKTTLSLEDRWKIAYRLWELNEIRKNICIAYLSTDTDFSKWTANYEKLTSLAFKSNEQLTKEVFENAEKFLKLNINPSEVFPNINKEKNLA